MQLTVGPSNRETTINTSTTSFLNMEGGTGMCTHPLYSSHSNLFITFADDSTVVELVTNDNETSNREAWLCRPPSPARY